MLNLVGPNLSLRRQVDVCVDERRHNGLASQIDAHAQLKDAKWQLIYRATRDGAKAKTFHRLCDDSCATVTVARVANTGRLIGGFTRVAWASTYSVQHDPTAFLFSATETRRGGMSVHKFAHHRELLCQGAHQADLSSTAELRHADK